MVSFLRFSVRQSDMRSVVGMQLEQPQTEPTNKDHAAEVAEIPTGISSWRT